MKKFTCKNGYTCLISQEIIEKEPILKIDFAIKEYQVFNMGWKTHTLDGNYFINDKLYLNKKHLNDIISLFDIFLEEGYLNVESIPVTNRGFKINQSPDIYGNTISMQESSSYDPSLWFGVKCINEVKIMKNNQIQNLEFPQGDILFTDRLHLNITKLKLFKKILENELEKMNSVELSQSNNSISQKMKM